MTSGSGLSELGNPVPFALCCCPVVLPNSAVAFFSNLGKAELHLVLKVEILYSGMTKDWHCFQNNL